MAERFFHVQSNEQVPIPGAIQMRFMLHSGADDVFGLHDLLGQKKLYVPEYVQWQSKHHVALQHIANGTMSPYDGLFVLGKHKGEWDFEFHKARLEALYQTEVQVEMLDLPLGHEIELMENQLFYPLSFSPLAGGGVRIRSKSSEKHFFQSYEQFLIDEEQITFAREEYMVEQLQNNISLFYPEKLQTLDQMIAEVGLYHYGITSLLSDIGIQVQPIIPSGSEAYIEYTMDHRSYIRETDHLDQEFVYHMLMEYVLGQVYHPNNAANSASRMQLFNWYHVLANSFDMNDIIEIFHRITTPELGKLPNAHTILTEMGISIPTYISMKRGGQ